MLSADHGKTGRPRLGCIVGTVTAFGIVLVVLGLLLPALSADHARPRRCSSNVKQLLYACTLYFHDNADSYPPDLGTLHANYVSDPELFICPDSRAPVEQGHAGAVTDKNVTYCYVSGLTAADPVHYVLVFDEEWNHDGEGVHYACISGQVAWETDIAALHDQLAKQKAELAAKGRTTKIIRPSWSTWPEPPEFPLGRQGPHDGIGIQYGLVLGFAILAVGLAAIVSLRLLVRRRA